MAISQLKVGDNVTAYDPSTGKTSTQTVQRTFINHDTDLVDVTLQPDQTKSAAATAASTAAAKRYHDALVAAHGAHASPAKQATAASMTAPLASSPADETVDTTLSHPWLTADRGWETVANLHVGEQVREAAGGTATVEAITTVPGVASMYDLTVSNVHTFAVGNGHFVVHNCGTGSPDPSKLIGTFKNANIYEGQILDAKYTDPVSIDYWPEGRNFQQNPRTNYGPGFTEFITQKYPNELGSDWWYTIESRVNPDTGQEVENHFWQSLKHLGEYYHHHP